MKNIPIGWTATIRDPQLKKNFEQSLRSSTLVLDRLREMLEYKLEELEQSEMSDQFFEAPNLDERFYRNQGRKKELRELLRLLDF